jgi:alkanesulfonate monooxygenase SsuD/methylene tetrahydromethanopterin reductase-like flavin-dependent oxidoreductase (luciferase family)
MMLGHDVLPLTETIERARIAEDLGVNELWFDQLPDQRDVGVVVTAVAAATGTVRLGSAVLPVHVRHPAAMAQLALSVDEASGGRFTLGLGIGHPFVTEYMLGLTTGSPLSSMREYVEIVRALLREGRVDSTGKYFTARLSYLAVRRPEVPIMLAGLRPKMIRLAVEQGDGLMLWLCPPEYIRDQVMPHVRAACAEFGRDVDTFPVTAMVPTYSSTRLADRRSDMRDVIGRYAMMPYYRRVLEDSGFRDDLRAGRIGDELIDRTTIIGDAELVRERLAEYRAVGCVAAPSAIETDQAEFIDTVTAVCGG